MCKGLRHYSTTPLEASHLCALPLCSFYASTKCLDQLEQLREGAAVIICVSGRRPCILYAFEHSAA